MTFLFNSPDSARQLKADPDKPRQIPHRDGKSGMSAHRSKRRADPRGLPVAVFQINPTKHDADTRPRFKSLLYFLQGDFPKCHPWHVVADSCEHLIILSILVDNLTVATSVPTCNQAAECSSRRSKLYHLFKNKSTPQDRRRSRGGRNRGRSHLAKRNRIARQAVRQVRGRRSTRRSRNCASSPTLRPSRHR